MTNLDDDLNDPLAELFGGSPAAAPVARPTPPASYKPVDFSEPCKKCRGSGNFVGYTGRVFGPCFACKGQGKLTYKTSPQQRAKAAERTAVKRVEKLAEKQAWREAHRAEIAWLTQAAERQHAFAHRGGKVWDFPIQLSESLAQYGTLTEGQIGAVRKCMERDAARKAERAAETASAPAVDISKIMSAFDRARGEASRDREGIKWLKLRLDTFIFSDAPARGQWKAAVLVREGDTKLGRIQEGRFLRSRECDDATEARIIAAATDPASAATAYGLRTGTCSCCGAELTNAESRARGIGPICAERFFGG